MCLSCGCLQPANPHGDDRNIMLSDLQAATATEAGQGLTVEEVAHNIGRTLDLALGADPMQVLSTAYQRPTLVFDIDGILAFLAETICAALNARFDTSYQADAMTTYRIEDIVPLPQAAWLMAEFKKPYLYANSAPDFHAIDVVCAAQAAGYVTLIASDRRDAQLDAVTRDWLDRWRVSFDGLYLLGPGGKIAFMKQFNPRKPAVLIDDDPVKQITIPREGVQVWTPTRPWTPNVIRPGVWRFGDWSNLSERLELS